MLETSRLRQKSIAHNSFLRVNVYYIRCFALFYKRKQSHSYSLTGCSINLHYITVTKKMLQDAHMDLHD